MKLDEACRRLRENDPKLQKLFLDYSQIGDDGAKALAEALESNTTLQELDLAYNLIGSDGAKAVAAALESNTTLQKLYLYNDHVGADGAKALADALKGNTTLRELDLYNNQIGDDGAKALADALKSNTTLQKLSLWDNQIGDDGAKALAAALKSNTKLQLISLHGNQIGADGAKALAEALKSNATLQKLFLRNNQIGADGAKALANALQSNTTLQRLSLYNNQIGADGATGLADALKSNTTLLSLDLDKNLIGDDGGQFLLQMLEKHNGALRCLDLGGTSISDSLINKIYALVAANKNNTRNPRPQPLPTGVSPERREHQAAARKRREQEAAEQTSREQEIAEQRRREQEAVEQQRREQQAAEQRRREQEAAEQQRREQQAAAEMRRQQEEAAEQERRQHEAAAEIHRQQEAADKPQSGVQELANLNLEQDVAAAVHAPHEDDQYRMSMEDVQSLQEIKKCGLFTAEQLDALQKLTANIDDFDKSLESVRGLPDELKAMPEYVQSYFISFCQAFQRTYLASEVLSTRGVQGKLTGKNKALFASILGIVGKGLTKSGVPFLACSSILITLYTHQLQTKQNNSLWVFQDFFNGDSQQSYMLTYRYAAKEICKQDHFSELTSGTSTDKQSLIDKIKENIWKPLQEFATGNLKKVHLLRFEEMEPVGLKVIDDLHTITCKVLELWEQDQDKYDYFSGADEQTKAMFVLECLGVVARGSSYEQNAGMSKPQAHPPEEIGTAKPHVKQNKAVLNEPATASDVKELREKIRLLEIENQKKTKKIKRLEKHIRADDDQDMDVHSGGGQKQTLLSKNARNTVSTVDAESRERNCIVESDRRIDFLYQHIENVTSSVQDVRYKQFLGERLLSFTEAWTLIENILLRSSNDCSGGQNQHQRNPTVPPHEAVFPDKKGYFVISSRRLRIGRHEGKKLWKKDHKIKISQDHLKVKSIKYWFEANGLGYRYELHCKAVVMKKFASEIMDQETNTASFQQQSGDEEADKKEKRDYIFDPDGSWLA